MRQADAKLIAAIRSGQTFKLQNRTVDYDGTMARVRLHNSLICWQDDSGAVQFSCRGYHTKITAQVLNACLAAFNLDGRFYRQDGIIHRDGIPLV